MISSSPTPVATFLARGLNASTTENPSFPFWFELLRPLRHPKLSAHLSLYDRGNVVNVTTLRALGVSDTELPAHLLSLESGAVIESAAANPILPPVPTVGEIVT